MPITEVKSDISGLIWKIEVNVGDKVGEEDTLFLVESMKMEIPLMAPADGVVKEIKVREGDTINEGDVVALLEE